MSPAEIRVYLGEHERNKASTDEVYAHYVHLLMNKMRQSKKDKAVKPDQIRMLRHPDEIPKEGVTERQRKIQEERTGVVDLTERRRYLNQYQKKYGSLDPRPKSKRGGDEQ
jgi:HD-like signal output (HDOD) protein